MEHGYRFDRAVISDRARLAREARERLEKAAPDLLEACKALVEYVEQEHDSLGDFAYFSYPVCVKAKDAIAKAEKGE